MSELDVRTPIARALTGARRGGILVLAALVLLVGAVVSGQTVEAQTARPTVTPRAPSIPAKAYLLQDFHSGAILAERNADERSEPASLTKIMTSYVVFSELANGGLKLDEEVTISEKARQMPGSRMFVEVNSRVSVDDLVKGVIIQSGNDASVALAEHIAGSEEGFASLMNEHAAVLGMTGTNFVNAEGLPDPNHYTTARDMAILTRALIQRFPKYYALHAEREFTYNDITQKNRNELLWRDDSIDGVKTGYTSSAGYCLVTSAQRNNMRLISVIMGSKGAKQRSQESYSMLTFGFRFFETHRIYAAREALQRIRVWEGETKALGIGIAEDLYLTVPRGAYKRVSAELRLHDRAVAPVQNGEPRGVLRVMLDDKVLAKRNLIALESVKEGGLWQRWSDKARHMFE